MSATSLLTKLFRRTPTTYRHPRPARTRLGVLPLEDRSVPAVTAVLGAYSGVLTVTGTDAADTIRLEGVDGGYNVTVEQAGANGPEPVTIAVNWLDRYDYYTKVPASWVVRARVFAGGGNDSVAVGEYGTWRRPAEIDAGDGADVVYAGGGDDRVDAGPGDDTVFGEAGHDTLLGGPGSDWLFASEGNDLLYGATDAAYSYADGTNYLYGGGGDDTVYGGNATDSVFGSYGRDWLWGQAGNDTIYGDADGDALDGGGGNDKLDGGAGGDNLVGQVGSDTLAGGPDNDTLYGAAYGDGAYYYQDGPNSLSGDAGNDSVVGGNGNDSLYGGTENDTLRGGAGNDRVTGGDGNDWEYGDNGGDTVGAYDGPLGWVDDPGHDFLYGGDGNDRVAGGDGWDRIEGNNGADALDGGVGDDFLAGASYGSPAETGPNADTLNGGAGNDTLWGGAGNDQLAGGPADDRLHGDAGDDLLRGEAGNDTLYGGTENDALYGGLGADRLWGEAGNDGLYAGIGDGRETLDGGLGADRFLVMEDVAPDAGATDAVITFRNSPAQSGVMQAGQPGTYSFAAGFWDNTQVERVDVALGNLHRHTGNTRLLKTAGGAAMSFAAVGKQTDSNAFRSGGWNTGTEINYVDIASRSDATVQRTVYHEFGHNWDDPTENPYATGFRAVSGWVERATNPDPTQYTASTGTGDNWYYRTAAAGTFARAYGLTNPDEDMATTWEAYFMFRYHGGTATLTREGLTRNDPKWTSMDSLFNSLR